MSGAQLESSGPDPFSRIVTIENRATSAVSFSARIQAKTVLAGWEDRWWNSVLLYKAQATDGVIPANQSRKVSITAVVPSPMLATFPRVQFWLSVVVDGKTSDEVLLGGAHTFVVAQKSLYRLAAPGPVALSGLDAPSRWNHSAGQTGKVSISNMTGTVQVVEVWFYLAVPNDLRPWTDPSLTAGPIQVSLNPWTTKAIPMRAARSPVGRWELSAWVHYKKNAATFLHSDELFLVQQITIQ